MDTFEKNIEKYAELSVKFGVNIQKGQKLVILADIETADFVRKAAKKAYEAGASEVHVHWSDEDISWLKSKHASMEVLETFPAWGKQAFESWVEEGAAILSISSSNPDLFKDIDPERITTSRKASAVGLKNFNAAIRTHKISWVIISVPTKAWAEKIFPDLNEEEQISKLWDSIFKATRADMDDPMQAWEQHITNLESKLEYLNGMKFKNIKYSAPGTDLTVELPEKHLWCSAGSDSQAGIYNVVNIPSEEVFTLPSKEGVNGVVSSTKPLNYAGNLIDNFSLTLKNGKIVDFQAETGYEALKGLIETDENSVYLGEIALVPHQSPISDMNVIFYNTLYDENASCHLAIGSAIPFCLEGGTKMSEEELKENGANISLTHVDFMMGSAEMNIDGETHDGTIVPLFRNGNWAL